MAAAAAGSRPKASAGQAGLHEAKSRPKASAGQAGLQKQRWNDTLIGTRPARRQSVLVASLLLRGKCRRTRSSVA